MPLIDFFAPDTDWREPNEQERAAERALSIEVERRRGWKEIDAEAFTGLHPITAQREPLTDWAAERAGHAARLQDEFYRMVQDQVATSGFFQVAYEYWLNSEGFTYYAKIEMEWDGDGADMDEKEVQTPSGVTYPTWEQAVCAGWIAAFDAGWFEWFTDWPGFDTNGNLFARHRGTRAECEAIWWPATDQQKEAA